MSDYLYEGLTVSIRLTEDYAQFGVVVNGRFHPFGARKINGFLADDAEAKASAQDQAQQQPPQA